MGKPRWHHTICPVKASESGRSNNAVTAPGGADDRPGKLSHDASQASAAKGCSGVRSLKAVCSDAGREGDAQPLHEDDQCAECGATRYDKTRLPHANTAALSQRAQFNPPFQEHSDAAGKLKWQLEPKQMPLDFNKAFVSGLYSFSVRLMWFSPNNLL